MDWQKELEARLADDPRLERKDSRYAAGTGFFYKGKEIAYFPEPATVFIRLSAATIFALRATLVEECVQEVSKDGIRVRLSSAEDLEFAQKVLGRIYREKAGERRPEGKNAKPGGWSAKLKANQSLDEAKVLNAMKRLKVDPEK